MKKSPVDTYIYRVVRSRTVQKIVVVESVEDVGSTGSEIFTG